MVEEEIASLRIIDYQDNGSAESPGEYYKINISLGPLRNRIYLSVVLHIAKLQPLPKCGSASSRSLEQCFKAYYGTG